MCLLGGGRTALWALAFHLASCCAPAILSPHKSTWDVDGRPRIAQHAGVDFGAPTGSPILAAADGDVVAITINLQGCGFGVLLHHDAFDRFTVYCHMERVLVEEHQTVRRGDVIGQVGTSGNSGGVPHVHLELCTTACPIGHKDGIVRYTEDPLAVSQGFFSKGRRYANDRLVLTYPVRCQDSLQR